MNDPLWYKFICHNSQQVLAVNYFHKKIIVDVWWDNKYAFDKSSSAINDWKQFLSPVYANVFPKLLSQIKNCEVVPGIPRLEYKTGTCTEFKKLAASC